MQQSSSLWDRRIQGSSSGHAKSSWTISRMTLFKPGPCVGLGHPNGKQSVIENGWFHGSDGADFWHLGDSNKKWAAVETASMPRMPLPQSGRRSGLSWWQAYPRLINSVDSLKVLLPLRALQTTIEMRTPLVKLVVYSGLTWIIET
jgi:hypothetical protein